LFAKIGVVVALSKSQGGHWRLAGTMGRQPHSVAAGFEQTTDERDLSQPARTAAALFTAKNPRFV
jgi:hypothetical protein